MTTRATTPPTMSRTRVGDSTGPASGSAARLVGNRSIGARSSREEGEKLAADGQADGGQAVEGRGAGD